MGLLTTTVGWFPKPVELRRARWRHAEGEIDEAELAATEERATARALRLQERIGLDLLVDGQMDRGDMVEHFAAALEGTEPGGLVRCFGNRYYRRPRIVGELSRARPVTVARWRAAQTLTARPVKAILVGPYTMMDWSFDEHYGSRERCCLALAEAVRAEAEDLAAAGAAEIEIDEPAISARPEELELAAEALGRVTTPLAGRARTWTHVCYGDLAPVIGAVLALPVDGVLLELANSEFELLEALADLPAGKLLGAGIVDVLREEVEPVELLGERIARLLELVPRERLWLAPDAGLRTLRAASVEAKLRALVQAARAA